MRIISGKYKGITIEGYDILGTRPTMDRVKESLFAMIQTNLKDATILDLFAGSGSLGLESLSNGAKIAYFVDYNKKSIETIKKTVNKNSIREEIHYELMDAHHALNQFQKQLLQFDIIFLDPPYQDNQINSCLNEIVSKHLLNENGIVVCEYETELLECHMLNQIKQKRYGDKWITIYQNKPSDKIM